LNDRLSGLLSLFIEIPAKSRFSMQKHIGCLEMPHTLTCHCTPGGLYQMTLRRFLSDACGNVATSFAIASVPLLAAAGAAIDFGAVLYAKTDADSAADAAVLAAIRASEEAYLEDKSNWKQIGELSGVQAFKENLKTLEIASSEEPAIEVSKQNGRFVAELEYEISYPTNFMHLVSTDSVKISNKVSAESGGENYLSIHFVIDNSASMGIGASIPDQQRMVNEASMGNCAFACHFSNGPKPETVSTAKALGIDLRIDVVKDAIKGFVNDINSRGYAHDQIQVSLHTFANDLKTVQTATTDLDDAIESVDDIVLDRDWGQGGTNMRLSLEQLAHQLPTSGDGSSPGKRKSFVIVLGDGVENSSLVTEKAAAPGSIQWGHETAPRFVARPGESYVEAGTNLTFQAADSSACDAVKTKGHTVMMTQVAYVRPLNERASDTGRLDYVMNVLMDGPIGDAFRACASNPAYSFYAADSDGVEPAFDEISAIIRTSMPMRLTN
jgi:hypothetical protein